MKRVVLDTDIVIDYLRQPRKNVLFKSLVKDDSSEVLLPAICLTELYIGESASKPKERRKIKKILNEVRLVLASETISKRAGALMRTYTSLYIADALVAATALEVKAALCTFNRSHFEGIRNLELFDAEGPRIA